MKVRAALVLALALAVALLAHTWNVEIGAATARMLVDSTDSELTGPAPLGAYRADLAAQLAVTYALYLRGDQATTELGHAMGLRGERVAASGPFTLLLGRTNLAPAVTALSDPIPVDHAYRLVLDVDGVNPVLSFYAQAPSARQAAALVNAARALLARHVLAQQASYRLNSEQAAVLRPLGPTVNGLVDGGARWELAGAVFVFVLLLVGLPLYAYRRRRHHLRHRPARQSALAEIAATGGVAEIALPGVFAEIPPPGVVAEIALPGTIAEIAATGGEWPYTTRLLPWALAGFVAMVFLVPFDAIDLPVNLPLDSSLDRPLLVGLVLLWLSSMALLSRAARPRVRLTRVHFAVLLFFAVCCLGVALDGAALANMDEVTLVVKKLALLASYVVFFGVVASALRPREVPRFAALIVALGVVVAVATVVEYRLHYNVFYDLWGRLLPIVKPAEFDAPDSIGRLTVYGPTSQPLELAALLAMVLPFAVMGAIDAATRRRRLLYSLAIGLLLAGGVATSRKTSLIAPAGAILLLLVYRPRAVGRSLLGLALVLGVLVHFTSPGALGSVLSQLEPGHVNGVLTTTDRTARYDAVLPDIMRHLLLGRGFGSYDPHKYRILDNEYLGLAITAGLLGLLAYCAIFAAMMSAAHGLIGSSGRTSSLALAALASVGVVALTSALFDVLSFPHVPYLLFFVAAMIIALRERPPTPERPVAAERSSLRRPAPSEGRGGERSRHLPLLPSPLPPPPPLLPPPRMRRSPGAPVRSTPARLAGE